MIVRTLKSASTAALFRSTTSREVVSRGDQMGHAVFDTRFPEGATDTLSRDATGEFPAQAHYCLAGSGVATIGGRTVQLAPDVLVVARGLGSLQHTGEGGGEALFGSWWNGNRGRTSSRAAREACRRYPGHAP